MSFQQFAQAELPSARIGGVTRDGPRIVNTYTLVSAPESNVIGRAFTEQSGVDRQAATGIAGGGAFAGIFIEPNSLALFGTGNQPLAPSLEVPDGTGGQLMTTGQGLAVNLVAIGTGLVGEGIYMDDVTGELSSGTAGAGQTQINGASISGQNITAPGLAFIDLNHATI